ncbi:MAG: gas vesicle [Gemmatimonadetes bacterium]|nr:gas vesicle [Gemmatimonadota bacterium]
MGLLSTIVFWPVTGPVAGIRWTLGKVQRVVEDELVDDTPVKEALMELQMRLELGDIDDEVYVAEEATLMRQLRDIREWRERLGMGTAGGPVRMARPSDDAEAGNGGDEDT